MATILIVDDLSANRRLLVTLLRRQGHRLIEAADGTEGLAAVLAEPPDLVITDVLMPKMDGYEFVRQLRLDPSTRGIPVIFHTAYYGEREARALASSRSVTWVLTKPAKSADVLATVSRALSIESETETPPDSAPPTAEFDREQLRLLTHQQSESAGDLRTANARLRALINIGLELASERDFDRLLERLCAAARDLFCATYVTIGIIDRNDRKVERLVTCGADAANWMIAGETVSGMLGTVVDERRTLRGDNPGGHPANLQLPFLHAEVQAYLAAPIASPSQSYGWICLVGNDGRSFTEDDEHLVVALSGQVGRIYELEHEIRERKRAEEESRRAARLSERAEQEFRALFAANPLPMWIYELTTLQFLEVNDAAVQRYGYERAEFLAMTIRDIRPPEDIDGLLRQVGEPREAWQDSGNWRHRVKSGRIIDVDITSHTITFAGQSACLVVARDITER